MKTKEEIVESHFGSDFHEVSQPCCLVHICNAMEEYAQAYHEDKTRWVKCSERLPEKNGYYIAWCIRPNEPGLINYHISTGWQNGFYNDRVTHWQEITPPKINAE